MREQGKATFGQITSFQDLLVRSHSEYIPSLIAQDFHVSHERLSSKHLQALYELLSRRFDSLVVQVNFRGSELKPFSIE